MTYKSCTYPDGCKYSPRCYSSDGPGKCIAVTHVVCVKFTRNTDNGKITFNDGRVICSECGADLGPSGMDEDYKTVCGQCSAAMTEDWLTENLPVTNPPQFGGAIYGV